MTHDAVGTSGPSTRSDRAPGRFGGLALAMVSAGSFGLSGPLAAGLLDTGWSPGAIVLVRIALAAVVVAPFGIIALRGQWRLLRQHAGTVVTYGVLAVAGAQFCYFSAVSSMEIGPALLIEYTAPAAVVGWMWLRHSERPGRLTVAGAGIAALGLVLVLDLLSGADLSATGVLWALGAMVGVGTYFVISAQVRGLPPLVLAAAGLVLGAVLLGLLGAVGVLPMHGGTTAPTYAGQAVIWWVPLLVLGVVTAGLAYTTGILAARRLGSRLASFVGLLEVVAAIGLAWLLLDQLPGPVQLLGGLLILAGVVAVQLGERDVAPSGS